MDATKSSGQTLSAPEKLESTRVAIFSTAFTLLLQPLHLQKPVSMSAGTGNTGKSCPSGNREVPLQVGCPTYGIQTEEQCAGESTMISMMTQITRKKPTLWVPPWASVQIAKTEAEKENVTNPHIRFMKGASGRANASYADGALMELWSPQSSMTWPRT